jgi:type IV secretory pathway VirB3-like protein
MSTRNAGLTADALFVGATRPPMRSGVTYAALLFNLVFTMEVFLLTKNLLTLALAAPIHWVCVLLCARDPRFFDLILLWGRTRRTAYCLGWRSCPRIGTSLPGVWERSRRPAVRAYDPGPSCRRAECPL